MELAQTHAITPIADPNMNRQIRVATQAMNLRTQTRITRHSTGISHGIRVSVQEVGKIQPKTCSFSVITEISFTEDLLVIKGLDNSGRHVTKTFQRPYSLDFSKN